MFRYLFIDNRTVIACDYEQGGLFHSAGPHSVKTDGERGFGKILRRMERERVETETRNRFLAVGEACVAIFRPITGFKRRAFVSSGF